MMSSLDDINPAWSGLGRRIASLAPAFLDGSEPKGAKSKLFVTCFVSLYLGCFRVCHWLPRLCEGSVAGPVASREWMNDKNMEATVLFRV